jgi:2-oxoglutarate ferredoxin oxidoreductase subunit alpha
VPSDWIKSLLPQGGYYFSGNEAAAEGALAAGCRFYAGYPITPSSEIMEHLAGRMPEVGGIFIQMEDEIGSISAVVGAAWAGAKAMTATSGPGFSLMQETIGYAAFTETPCVIIDVQRAGPCTGQATRVGAGDIMQAKWGSHGDYQLVALSPWSVQEMYDLTVRAFNCSEQYRVPVIVLAEEAVGHLRENIRVGHKLQIINRKKQKGAPPFATETEDGVPPMPAFGEGEHLAITGSTHDGYGLRKTDDPDVQERLINRINQKIISHKKDIIETEEYFLDDAEVALVAYGFTARSSLYALKQMRKQKSKVGLLRLKTLWPFPEDEVIRLGQHVRKMIVPEMNRGQVAGEVRKVFSGDLFSLTQTNGEIIRPETIMAELERIL